MRKVFISLVCLFLTSLLWAQDTSLTANKIIENGKEYYLYEVHESEGFMAIGRKFGIAYQDIVEINKETTKDGLKVGQILRIPVVQGRNTSNEEVKSNNFIFHKVNTGETVFFISRKYGVSIQDIVTNNPGADKVLSIGQELKIPKVTQDIKTPVVKLDTTVRTPKSLDPFRYHVVEPKETATGIARKYGISIQNLAEVNPGIAAKPLTVGSELRIPEKKKNKEKEIVSEKLTDTDYTYHRIKNGETLESIAILYDMPVSIINKSNAIDNKLPPMGYMLKIPHSYQFKVEVSKENQEYYTVKKKDDIRVIAEHYQVPIMNIKAANPHVKKWTKLKKGTQLVIPTLSVEKIDTVVTRIPESSEQDELQNYFETQKTDLGDTINIAFIWPLYLERNDTLNALKRQNNKTHSPNLYPSNPIFREFFYGALIAINDLKEQGLVVNIKNIDTERGLVNILKVLKDKSLADADIIFGPGFGDQTEPLAEFCLKQRIRLVLPFTTECKSLVNNPYVFQVLPSNKIKYTHTAKEVASRYSNANIIMVKGGKGDKRETLFIELLKSELYNPDSVLSRHISYKELTFNKNSMYGLLSLLSKEKLNLIIIPEKTEKLHTLINPVIENYISRHPEIDIKLLGFNEWQKFKDTELENIFNVECELYTSLYADFHGEEDNINNFKSKYNDYFLTAPTSKYPYYSMLGYDVTNYFMKGLFTYGNELENNLELIEQNGLCVDFNFERVNNWGGFINKTIYTIEYTKDFDIKLIK